MTANALLERAVERPKALSSDELASLLDCDDEGVWREIFAAAREVKAMCGKSETLPRGLIECSNVCAKDCLYCGIRRSRAGVVRYRLTEEEALAAIAQARSRKYPAVAFQAGEIESEANTAFYERLLAACGGLEVTLSLGEQTEATYRRWKTAGALRYLIRIETSNRSLYSRLHPSDCSFDRRLECIRTLKRIGYVTGSGVMIGLPGQTIDDLANDLIFFGDENLDMIGMGPYVPCAGTPLASEAIALPARERTFELALRMIALARLHLHGVNIVAATALEALDSDGREKGIAAGANVVMPDLTPSAHIADYALYPGKPLTSR